MCGTGSSILLGFVNAREVGVSSRNLVSRTFPQIFKSMLTPMSLYLHARWRDRPRLGAGKRQLSPPIPSATLATDAGLHPQVICTCVSLKFIQIRVTNT